MADNTALNSGTGGDTLATDDVTTLNGGASTGIKVPRVKVMFGADNTATDVNSAAPLPVDGSGVTQPISAASLPLPTGASTAAKQPALGTAGTASADVITIQGIASMTAVKVDPSAVTQPISFAPATTGGLALPTHVVSAATTNAQNLKASAGQLYRVEAFNNAAYPVYVKFHNTAGAPTAGVGVVLVFGVQAGVGRTLDLGPFGVAFGTGVALTIVKGITDADATAVALSDVVVDVYVK